MISGDGKDVLIRAVLVEMFNYGSNSIAQVLNHYCLFLESLPTQ
jgi:hypothetical protein